MGNVVFLVYVHTVVAGVVHDSVEIDALVWCVLVDNGNGVDVGPHVGDDRHASAAGGTHAQDLKAVH